MILWGWGLAPPPFPSGQGAMLDLEQIQRERPLNVFVGTSEAGGFLYNLGEAYRALGHNVTTGIGWGLTHYDYAYDLHLDLDEPVDWDEVRRRLTTPGATIPEEIDDSSNLFERILWVIASHDLFVLMFTSLQPDGPGAPFGWGFGRELELLSALGKRVVVLYTGYEVRHPSVYTQFAMQQDIPTQLDDGQRRAGLGWPLDRVVRNLRRAELHADLILSLPGMAGLALRPYMHLFAPIDISAIRPRYPDRETPLVVHAPSHLAGKGTPLLVEALKTLELGGLDGFSLKILQRIPHKDLMREYRAADVVVDQILFCHGAAGVEAMAAGAALACFDHPALAPYPTSRPIWHLDHRDLVAQLGRLLEDRPLRSRLAREGRRYAVRHHDRTRVAASILERLAQGPHAPMEHNPTWFARHLTVPEGLDYTDECRALTAAVVDRWGLPEGVDRRELQARGLLPAP